MKSKEWRLYGAHDARLEDIELECAGEDGIVVEIVTNTICLSDYKGASLGTGHKRVPRDIDTNPIMFGHEVSGIVREVGDKWKSQFRVGQRVGLQPSLNIPGHELETVGYAWHTIGGDTTHVYLPSIVMEMGCLLPYDGDAFFKCSLAEPISCIVSAFRTNYHNAFCSHDLEVGIVDKGTMLLMAGCGAMGLGCIDIACHSPEKRPRRLVVTDIALRKCSVFLMPMTAIADFREKGRSDPFFAELDRICSANNGLWCKEAEEYLLSNAPKVEIGEPKEKVVERRIVVK